MLALLGSSVVGFFILGLPIFIVLLISLILVCFFFVPEFDLSSMIVQQFIAGFSPAAFACVPLFILAATIIAEGTAAVRLVSFVKAVLGHVPGGLAIVTSVSSTLFGAVSGSTQATVAAIGKTMRPMLLKANYPSSFTLGLIINASDIAVLIPPSIAAIIYGVISQTSVGKLFLAGVGPGVLICILFSIYCFFYSKAKKIGVSPKASWGERRKATKKAALLVGFPIIIMGGIYTGTFTPTEAAAVSVAYALLLEGAIYRGLNFAKLQNALLSTAVITGVVYVLVGAANALSWILIYHNVPQLVFPYLFGADPSLLRIVITINVCYFIVCMFMVGLPALLVLTPFFAPYIVQAGINPIWIGTMVILQLAIGSATPPLGCDIFTAMVIFKRPYLEVIGHTYPFVAILLLAVVLIIIFPDIVLFLPDHMWGY